MAKRFPTREDILGATARRAPTREAILARTPGGRRVATVSLSIEQVQAIDVASRAQGRLEGVRFAKQMLNDRNELKGLSAHERLDGYLQVLERDARATREALRK